jgi:DNA-binding FadR family transcriptional regulator
VKFDCVNPMSSVAVYTQIENLVQFAIASGELKAGEQIPPAGNVAEALGVNVNTVESVQRFGSHGPCIRTTGYGRLRSQGR